MACCPTEEKYGYDDSRFEKDVDAHFHCSICYNVLKEPMMCRNNEHIFCRECITEHLNVNSHTCPECNEDLTVDTLRRARLVSNYLSELKIKCDYSDRGCQEYIRLAELKCHVENCGFAPVKCSNEECEMMVNKRELIHLKCHNCVKIEQVVETMKEKMERMEKKIEGLASKVDVDNMKTLIEGMEKKNEGLASKDDVYNMKALMVQMFEKLQFLENTIVHTSNTLTEDILVAGGWDVDDNYLKSVERFSWKTGAWEKVCSMSVGRKGATSFVYENQLFFLGGCKSRVIEVINLIESPLQLAVSEAVTPLSCCMLRSVVYQNRVFLFCSCNKVDLCSELSLTAPYTSKQLCAIPEPPRKFCSVVGFEHKALIFGGRNIANNHLLDSVLQFDLITTEFKEMPSLPCGMQSMAVVRWGDQAILIGGFNKDGQSRKVFMYDCRTGKTIEMPSMLEERDSCAAVITGNTIIVMGGRGRTIGRSRSVEAFSLGGHSWSYLPAMNDIRSVATAAILPTRNVR